MALTTQPTVLEPKTTQLQKLYVPFDANTEAVVVFQSIEY
jgi:hypothetical protein